MAFCLPPCLFVELIFSNCLSHLGATKKKKLFTEAVLRPFHGFLWQFAGLWKAVSNQAQTMVEYIGMPSQVTSWHLRLFRVSYIAWLFVISCRLVTIIRVFRGILSCRGIVATS